MSHRTEGTGSNKTNVRNRVTGTSMQGVSQREPLGELRNTVATLENGNVFEAFTIFQKQIQSTVVTGLPPLIVASDTQVLNLNSSKLEGFITGTSGNKIALMDGANSWSGVQTLASPVLNGSLSGSAFLDDNSFGTADQVTVSSTTAIKTYINTQIAASVTSSGAITDHSVVRGDGGAKGIQGSGVLLDDSDNMSAIANLDITGILSLTDTDTGFSTSSGNLLCDVAAGKIHDFRIDNTTRFSVAATLIVPGTVTIDVGSLTKKFKKGFFSDAILCLTLESDIAPGNPPLIVASTDRVVNLNADTVDGIEAAAMLRVDGSLALSADWDAGAFDILAESFHADLVNPSHATNPAAEVGNIWYNEATKTHRLEADDAIHNVVGCESLTTADDVVGFSSSEVIFGDTKDIAADSLVVGASYEWAAWGEFSSNATQTYTFRFKLDAVTVVDSGALTQTGASAGGWFLKGQFTVRSIGASGTVQGNGLVGCKEVGVIPIATSSPVTVDTTQILTAGVSIQMSVGDFGKTGTLQQFTIKKIS